MSEPEGFLKRHGFLVAGVALPILVVIVFVLARTLPRVWVADPRFDVVYGVRSNYVVTPRSIESEVSVVDERLRVRWTRPKDPVYHGELHPYRLNPASEMVEEIPLVEPADVDIDAAPSTKDLFVAGLEGFRVDPSPRSPDGYEFEASTGGGSGLLSELLVSRNRQARSVIRKSGRVIVLPRADDPGYGYPYVQFLGWLIPVENGR